MRTLPSSILLLFCLVAGAATADAQARSADRASEPISTTDALVTFDSVWSRVRNAHYDTAMRGIDWGRVREELRPKAERVGTLGELRTVLGEMLERLGESHYGIIPEEIDEALDDEPGASSTARPGDVGMAMRLIGSEMVVTHVDPDGPAARSGVRPGWIVDSVGRYGAQRIAKRLAALETETERRHAQARLPRVVETMFEGPSGTPVRAVFHDASGRRRVLSITRRDAPGEIVQMPNLPTFRAVLEYERRALTDKVGCVGIIRFNIWMTALMDDVDRAVDALRDCRGIVVDLRGNPGGLGFMVSGVGGHFLDSTVSLGTMRTRVGTLRFTVNPRRVSSSGTAVRPYFGPLAIVTDGLTASTSEVFAAGMQAIGRARVFGQISAGEALPAMATRLPTGDVLLHVTADLVAPNGQRVEGRGVIPDEAIPLRRADLLAGRDAPLEAAVKWIAHH